MLNRHKPEVIVINHASQDHAKARITGRFLAFLAAAVCLVVTIRVWMIVSAQQALWPIPGAYLIEMLALSLLAALAIQPGSPLPVALPGIACGGLFAFSVLASFSVGLFYLPVALLILIAGLLFTLSTRRSLFIFLAWTAAAVVIQSGIILAAINILYPN